jgi:hypothetical protein
MVNKKENVYWVKAGELGSWYPARGSVVALKGRFCVIDDNDNVLWWFTKKQEECLKKFVMEYGDVIVSVSEDRVKITMESGGELHIWKNGNVTGTALSGKA